MEKLNYFKNVLGSNVGEEVIVAIIKENSDDIGKKFELTIMTKGLSSSKKNFNMTFLSMAYQTKLHSRRIPGASLSNSFSAPIIRIEITVTITIPNKLDCGIITQ